MRFVETAYETWHGVNARSETTTLVGDVTILRLKFETDGITYNLGTIDNKQTGDRDPVNDEQIEVGLSKMGKWILGIIALILLLVILMPILPYIAKLIVWIILLPFKLIAAIVKGI